MREITDTLNELFVLKLDCVKNLLNYFILKNTEFIRSFQNCLDVLPQHMHPYVWSDYENSLYFKNGHNQAIRLPIDFQFEGVNELEITKSGGVITLRPIRPDWQSLANSPKADPDFMIERNNVISDEGRVIL